MASAFDRIADIIAETSDVPRETITPDSHVIDDLGIDWTQEVNAGTAPAEQYFVMKNLAARIEELVAAKAASA